MSDTQNTHNQAHTDVTHLVDHHNEHPVDNHTPIHHVVDAHAGDDPDTPDTQDPPLDTPDLPDAQDPPQDKPNDAFDQASWGHPETGPMPAPREKADHIEMHEVVEHEVSPEVADYVEEQKDLPEIPQDLKDMGVEATQKPVQYPHHQTVKVPLTDEQIIQASKAPIDSSIRWLAEFCKRVLHKANIRLKVAEGKATRIMDKP